MEGAAINWAQILVNSLLTGSIYALVAIGLSMTWGILKFPNIAHGEFLTFGAYIGCMVLNFTRIGFAWAIIIGSVSTGILGLISYLLIFRLLVRAGSSPMQMAVASVGYGLALRYIMQQIWGPGTIIYKMWRGPFELGPIRLTWLWFSIIIIALALVTLFHLILTRTKTGKAMRAVSNNPMLAASSGINVEKILLIVWFLGSSLAGIGGIFRGSDTLVYPVLGWGMMMPAFAVTSLGGIGSFYGAVASAYLLGLAENICLLGLVALNLSGEYRSAVAFAVLIIVLLFKPEGLAGLKRE